MDRVEVRRYAEAIDNISRAHGKGLVVDNDYEDSNLL